FTARWHKLKGAGRLANEDIRHRFRAELILLQGKLVPFQRLLGHLAEAENFKEKSETPPVAPHESTYPLGGDIAFDALLGNLNADLWAFEKADIVNRRRAVL